MKNLNKRINIKIENVDVYCDNNQVSETLRKRIHKYFHVCNHNVSAREQSVEFVIKCYNI